LTRAFLDISRLKNRLFLPRSASEPRYRGTSITRKRPPPRTPLGP
jgi:hypothetical protein